MSVIGRSFLFKQKLADATEALSLIRNGQTVYVGSGVGEPGLLTSTLAKMAPRFWDVEVVHVATTPYEFILARSDLRRHFKYNTFNVSPGVSGALAAGTADHIPIDIGELPEALRRGTVRVDFALVQVSPPDSHGLCSLGVSVDATRAAIEAAEVVIAQVNSYMPVTFGDSFVPVEELDHLVEGNVPLIEVPTTEVDTVSLSAGKHVASLIQDGTTLYLDRGPICAAATRYLGHSKHLGIHTVFLTDDIMRLMRTRSVTNRRKRFHRGKTVASMVIGTKDLYEAVDRNPFIEMLPIDEVTDPTLVGAEDRFVAVQEVQEVELTGVARVLEGMERGLGGVPLGRDMLAGARRSPEGFSVVALRSTSPDGQRSMIVARSDGRGAYLARTNVDFVVTEYGIAELRGLTTRERAIALISIAHPRFREGLLEEAKRSSYVTHAQIIPPAIGCVYPSHYEFTHTLPDGLRVFFRPVKQSDARHFQRLFYSMSPQTARMRYHGTIKTLSDEVAQRMAAVDYSQDIAIIGLVDGPLSHRAVAEGRCQYNPSTNMGEFAIVVDEAFQGRGIGRLLAEYLKKIAYARGLAGIYAEVIQRNEATLALLREAWPTATQCYRDGCVTFTLGFPVQDVRVPKDAAMVFSGRFGDFSYGKGHPFSPGRAVAAMDTIQRNGSMDEPWMRVVEPTPVSVETLVETHAPEYIDALRRANDGRWDDSFVRFGLGTEECPIFKGIFDYVLLYVSATVTGANLIIEEKTNVVFNPLGGFHHAGRSFAEGFCYVNDVIVAINMLLARGMRVAYVDLDAHHGNGVQDAYYRDDRVLVVSVHESGRTLYPWSGFEGEIGEGIGRGYNINVPLPTQTDDELYGRVMERIVSPAVRAFSPAVVVATIGADPHRSDPLANLALTNNGMVEAIKHVRSYCPHMLLLGGGGYDLDTTTAAWCRMWAAANRIDDLPDYLLSVGGSFMSSAGMGAEIVDMPFCLSGARKTKNREEIDRLVRFHEEHTLPLIR